MIKMQGTQNGMRSTGVRFQAINDVAYYCRDCRYCVAMKLRQLFDWKKDSSHRLRLDASYDNQIIDGRYVRSMVLYSYL